MTDDERQRAEDAKVADELSRELTMAILATVKRRQATPYAIAGAIIDTIRNCLFELLPTSEDRAEMAEVLEDGVRWALAGAEKDHSNPQ